MNRADIRTRVKNRYNDTATVGPRFDDSYYNERIDEVYARFVADWPPREKVATVAFTASQRDAALPNDATTVYAVRKSATTTVLDGISTWTAALGRFDVDATGEPTSYLVWGGRLYLLPIPSAAYTAEVFYRGSPAALTTDTSEPEIPDHFHPALIEGVLGVLHGDDGNFNAAALHNGLFETMRTRALEEVSRDAGRYSTITDTFYDEVAFVREVR